MSFDLKLHDMTKSFDDHPLIMAPDVVKRLLLCGLVTLFLQVAVTATKKDEQHWQQDLSNDMKIGLAESGYKKVTLKCLEDEHIMQVDIELEDEFSGVIYTRGHFYTKEKDCFLKPKPGTQFQMKIPFSRCGSKKTEDAYKNQIVIQYDEDLIMPGDAAFSLECVVAPRNITVSADMNNLQSTETRVTSKISLADADPAGKAVPKHKQSTVTGYNGEVSFTPDDVRPRNTRNDEL